MEIAHNVPAVARATEGSLPSSKPPSSDGCKKPSPKSQRKKSGNQTGSRHLSLSLHEVEGKKVETRYMYEIPKITVETESV
jgi:hypothetical protein